MKEIVKALELARAAEAALELNSTLDLPYSPDVVYVDAPWIVLYTDKDVQEFYRGFYVTTLRPSQSPEYVRTLQE